MKHEDDKDKITQEEEKVKREIQNPQEQEKKAIPLEERGSLKGDEHDSTRER